MSHDHDHHHDHDHDHGHHHDHGDHHHHHDHDQSSVSLSFAEKLTKLLDHWIQHNDHHVEDYRKWASEARENDQAAVAEQLDAVADLTDTISGHFRKAAENVKKD